MLVLMFNRINSTKIDSGEKLNQLQVLELGENWFTQIDQTTFSMLPSLQNISLANNRIQKVASDSFNK